MLLSISRQSENEGAFVVMQKYAMFLVGVLAVCAPGCLSRQVSRDGIGIRQSLLDMYTDQIMDNLIRARNGLPFVQLAYSSVQVQDVDSMTGSVQDTYNISSDRSSNAVGLVTSVLRRFSNGLQLTGNARRDRTMGLKADPVTDKNDIYEKYLEFANNPALFHVSATKPVCQVHIMRKHGKCYYWVPLEAAQEFQQLCMKTTFMRGPETAPPPV